MDRFLRHPAPFVRDFAQLFHAGNIVAAELATVPQFFSENCYGSDGSHTTEFTLSELFLYLVFNDSGVTTLILITLS
jgi:hypothetical protein